MVAVQGAEPGTQARLGGQAVLRYTDHPLPSCHTSPRQRRATIWGCVTLIQARSCKSLTFSMSLSLFLSLSLFFFSGGRRYCSRWGADPKAPGHFVPPPRLGYSRTRPQQSPAREWAALKDSSALPHKEPFLPPVTHPQPWLPELLVLSPSPFPGRSQSCSFTGALGVPRPS